jgi:uncharacterized protein YceH (UPF0502 family)
MSTESALAAAATTAWPVLGLHERRVLGVLVEKAKTTPDVYPLSVNSLVAGCNQKSNRDPFLNMTEDDAEAALASCQQKGLAIKITGGRVIRWRHSLYEAWKVDKVDLAVLGELLLRGPQTEGELRTRASRMEPIDDLDKLRDELRPLTERKLVVYLTPENRRGTMLTHGFHEARELEHLRARHAGAAAEEHPPASFQLPTDPGLEARLQATQAEVAALRGMMSELQTTVAGLAEQLRTLREGLGA